MKEIEVVGAEVGTVRLSDVRGVDEGDDVAVVVLRRDGPPLVATIGFAESWASRGWMTQLRCPCCGSPARALRASGAGLYCARCVPHRTEHQRQRSLAEWRKLQGRQFDRLLRLLQRRGLTVARGEKAQRLADAIGRAAEARVDEMEKLTEAALSLGTEEE